MYRHFIDSKVPTLRCSEFRLTTPGHLGILLKQPDKGIAEDEVYIYIYIYLNTYNRIDTRVGYVM